MITLFTDFGLDGPWVGQIRLVLHREAPGVPVIDLQHDAPVCNPKAAAYLLAALVPRLPVGGVTLAVVDPGVGTERAAIVLKADGRWFVGPDNGLFHAVVRQASEVRGWEIDWRPAELSSSFHGRDLFAPVAAMIAAGKAVPGHAVDPQTLLRGDWPDDLAEVIYIDRFGNAATGMRSGCVADDRVLEANGVRFKRSETFGSVPDGVPFWYINSNGLVELALSRMSLRDTHGIKVGTLVSPI